VNPSLDVLLRYADRELAERIDDLQALSADGQDGGRPGRRRGCGLLDDPVGEAVRLQRVAGQKAAPAPRPTAIAAFYRGARRWSRASPSRRGSPRTTPRPAARHGPRRPRHRFHHSGPWAYGAPALAPHLAHGLYRAYHRYMAEYCAADPRRLKSMILALATDPAWSAQEIKRRRSAAQYSPCNGDRRGRDRGRDAGQRGGAVRPRARNDEIDVAAFEVHVAQPAAGVVLGDPRRDGLRA